MKLLKILTLLGLLVGAISAQPRPSFRPPNFSGMGPTRPATCRTGEVWFTTGATAGQEIYTCTTNVWTQASGGSSLNVPVSVTANDLVCWTNTTTLCDSGVSYKSIPAGQYTFSAAGIVAGDIDTAGANSTAMLALMATVNTAGGGTILCDKSGTYRFDSQLLFPNDAASPPLQSNITLTGIGGGSNWYAQTASEACILDLRYQGNLGAKIETRGRGALKITNLQLSDGSTIPSYSVTGGTLTNIVVTSNVAVATFASTITSGAYIGAIWSVTGSTTSALNNGPVPYSVTAVGASTITFATSGVSDGTYNNAALTLKYSAPFIHTTNTVLTVKDSVFKGNSSTTQNGIVFGGTSTNVQTTGLNDGFQGYGSTVTNNTFITLNAGSLFRAYANSVTFSDNTFINSTGTVAVQADNGLLACNPPQEITGLTLLNNLIEMNTSYVYGMHLKCANISTIIGNSFYDQNGTPLFDYYLDAGSLNNYIVPGYSNAVATKYFGGDATALQTTTIIGGNNYRPTGATGSVTAEIYGAVIKGRYNGSNNYAGPLTVADVFRPQDTINIGVEETHGNALIDAYSIGVGTIPLILNPRGGCVGIGSAATNVQDNCLSRNAAGIIQFGTTSANALGSWLALNGTLSGTSSAALFATATNCADSAGAAACGAASAGAVVIDAAASTTVVSTTAVTANSEIVLTFDPSLATRLSVTCNTVNSLPYVSARTAGTSFTIKTDAAPITNPACISYSIIN